MNFRFSQDSYPGKPRVLFIGHGSSSHTHAWIDLLKDAELNVRLFGLPTGYPPDDWPVRTYITMPPREDSVTLDSAIRQELYPTTEEWKLYNESLQAYIEQRQQFADALERNKVYRFLLFGQKRLNAMAGRAGLPPFTFEHEWRPPAQPQPKAASPQEWLADIIREWRPDIIHTLGLDPASTFYLQMRDELNLAGAGKWVVQVRGGPDLALHRFLPAHLAKIKRVFQECDQVIADNQCNYRYAVELGLSEGKISPLEVVPGTGGIDIASFEMRWAGKPSERKRLIVWPKAYEAPSSKALPVFEAIKIAWDRIQPCEIEILWVVQPEIEMWFQTLPQEIRSHCHLRPQLARDQALDLYYQARVLLAPSLTDGVPNSLYEAMAAGAFPIVSPLETIVPVVENERNVLFARNLYPAEIAEVLVRALNDDQLVDRASENNLALVKMVADRSSIRPRVIKFYENLAHEVARRTDYPLVTVITPSYNRADLLPETIESVLSQGYPNIQYIVLDDGSTDQSMEIINRYAARLIVEAHPNMGETATVNKAFRMAEGEFICVVNSDDPLLPGALRSLIEAIESDPDALVAYPDWVEIDPVSRPIKEMKLPDYDIQSMLTIFNVAMGPGTLFRRSALERYGYRDPHRRYTGDLEFWFRLACHGKLVHVAKILATHRTHPASASVSEKSSKMAVELISMTESLFDQKHLPPELLAQRKRIMSQVYYVASFYCPGEPLKRELYLFRAFLHDPKLDINRGARTVLSGIKAAGVFVLQTVKLLLRITLPRPAYSRVISWWMRLTGQK
jgi:glycosyltransferase involved in cell wall biosynthesis